LAVRQATCCRHLEPVCRIKLGKKFLQEPCLASACWGHNRNELWSSLLQRPHPQEIQLQQILPPTDEWWPTNEPSCSHLDEGKHAQRLALALDLDEMHLAKEEGVLGCCGRSPSYHYLVRTSRLLQTGSHVHCVSRHQEIARRLVARCHDFARVDAHPEQQPPPKERIGGDSLAQCQGSCQRSFRVIAMGSWQAKDRHDGIPDELLEGPTVLLNDTLGVGVVAAHQGANIFEVEALAQFCRASHIGKEDGHELSLFWHERTSTATMAGKANLRLDDG